MMCNVSPASSQFEETLNTLKYAARAKKIKTRPVENKELVELHIAEYKNIIEDLRNEITDLRRREVHNLSKSQMEQDDDLCYQCGLHKECMGDEVRRLITQLTDLFQEQLNMRKSICDIEVQNKLNRFEILKERELAKTGVVEQLNQINMDIAHLESSVDFNSTLRDNIKQRLFENMRDTESLLDKIQSRLSSEDSNYILEELVKNKMMELENMEMEGNLKMYEEVNHVMMLKIKQMQDILNQQGVHYDYEFDSDSAEFEMENEDEVEEEEDDEDDLNEINQEEELRDDGLDEEKDDDVIIYSKCRRKLTLMHWLIHF